MVIDAYLAQPDSTEKMFASTEAAGLKIDIWDKAATPESVAKCGYDAMVNGDLIKINEMGLNFIVQRNFANFWCKFSCLQMAI